MKFSYSKIRFENASAKWQSYCFGLIGLDLNWNSTEPYPLSYKNMIPLRIYEHRQLDSEIFKHELWSCFNIMSSYKNRNFYFTKICFYASLNKFTATTFDYKRPLLLTWFSFKLSMDK